MGERYPGVHPGVVASSILAKSPKLSILDDLRLLRSLGLGDLRLLSGFDCFLLFLLGLRLGERCFALRGIFIVYGEIFNNSY
jgi:hypothetical protein